MNEEDYEKFKKKPFCDEYELFELTEEQMDEIANPNNSYLLGHKNSTK